MSCSDKILRWSLQGLQGSLLSEWINPIKLTSIVVSDHPKTTPSFLQESLQRAIVNRYQTAMEHFFFLNVGTHQSSNTSSLKNASTSGPSVHVVPGKRYSHPSYAAAAAAYKKNASGLNDAFNDASSCSLENEPITKKLKKEEDLDTVSSDKYKEENKGKEEEKKKKENKNKPYKTKKSQKEEFSLSPSGVCLNWCAEVPFRFKSTKSKPPPSSSVNNLNDSKSSSVLCSGLYVGDSEVTVGASGLKQGANKKHPSIASYSRLSKHFFHKSYLELKELSSTSNSTPLKQDVVEPSSPYEAYFAEKELMGRMFHTGSESLVSSYGLKKWVRSSKCVCCSSQLSAAEH
jgi:hypothetical protein